MRSHRSRTSRSDGFIPEEAARVYDRIGRLQNTQAPIERAAVDRLVEWGDLPRAMSVFELGCGTGAFARRMLRDVLPGGCSYVGVDVSPRMVALARHAVEPWPERAVVIQVDGSLPLPSKDGSADRFVIAYVLDLLESSYARQIVTDAHRVLGAGGLLCVTSLTTGESRLGRFIERAWSAVWRHAPGLVGGCRPIDVTELLDLSCWSIGHHSRVERWGVPSEVLVAERI